MTKRHEKLGIKQIIQKTWMDKTVQMMLAGLPEKEIRFELDEYLSTQKQSGGTGQRGETSYRMAISLLSSWFAPEKELRPFRDDALLLAKSLRADDWFPLHWAVLSASYPFWFNVARQTGRLLNLQDQTTRLQIFNRLKEQYGDRETVSRNARYTVRSFVAWGALKDSDAKGCYEKSTPWVISDTNIGILLLESELLALPEGKGSLGALQKTPAFFPFQLPQMTGDFISQNNERIDVDRYGLDDEMLKLKVGCSV